MFARSIITAAVLTAAVSLGGCGAGTVSPTMPLPQAASWSRASQNIISPAVITGRIYVGDPETNSIDIFKQTDNGDVAPVAVLSGKATDLDGPYAVAVFSNGQLYVTDQISNSFTVYAAGASGNQAPLRRIAGEKTGLNTPSGIALDSNGEIYVANLSLNSICVFAAT